MHYKYKYVVTPAWRGVSGEVHQAMYSGWAYASRRKAKVAWKARGIRDNYMELIGNDHLFGVQHAGLCDTPTKAVPRGTW